MNGAPVEIAARDGVILRGLCWEGNSPALLLLHAPGEERDLDDWRPLFPYLLGEKIAFVALDLRGHGASGGDWNLETATTDIASAITWIGQFASHIVVCAAGASATHALCASPASLANGEPGSNSLAGFVLLSPHDDGAANPRGAGVPKLLLAGGHDPAALAAMNRLRAISIGPALSVSLPVAAQGTDLLTSSAAVHLREHLFQFWRERHAEKGRVSGSDRRMSDLFLARLGISPKGVES